MSRTLPVGASLVFLRKQSKSLKRAHARRDDEVCSTLRGLVRFRDATSADMLDARVSLQEIQHALALDYGFGSWVSLRNHVETLRRSADNRSMPKPFEAVFTGRNDQQPLVAGYRRERHSRGMRADVALRDDGFRIAPIGDDPSIDEHDLFPDIAEAIGDQDFTINLTLHPDSAPLEGGPEVEQRFGVQLRFENTMPTARVLFGFDAGTGNRPFCKINNGWFSYYVDPSDATGRAETITFERRGELFVISDSTNGAQFEAVPDVRGRASGRPLFDVLAEARKGIHLNVNDCGLLGNRKTLTGLSLFAESAGGRAFPRDAGWVQKLSISADGMTHNINTDGIDQSGVITGCVLSRGRQVPGSFVHVESAGHCGVHVTDEDGMFRLRRDPGEYRIKVEGRGLVTAYRAVSLDPQQTLRVDVELEDLGTDFYVDSSVSRSGDGTDTAPLRTIQEALLLCGPGDTVHLAPGTYSERFDLVPHVSIIGAGASRTLVTGQGYWSLALRPLMEECYVGSGDVLIKTDLPGVNLADFRIVAGSDIDRPFPDQSADELTRLIAAVTAVDHEDADSLEELLEQHPYLAKARFHAPDAHADGNTLLIRLAFSTMSKESSEDGLRAAAILIDRGADLEAVGGQYHSVGLTALGAAAWRNNQALAEYLIERSANPNGRDGEPMDRVAYEYHPDMARRLMGAGATCSLGQLLMLRFDAQLFDELDRSPERVNERDGEGRSVLHVAVASRRHEMIGRLIARGADTELGDSRGQTPFDLAHERTGDQRALRAFLASGVEPSLVTVVMLNDIAATRAVLDDDPGLIDTSHPSGMTLTDIAAARGFDDLHAFLVARGGQHERHLPSILRDLPSDHPAQPMLARTPAPNRLVGFVRIPGGRELNLSSQTTLMAWVYRMGDGPAILCKAVHLPYPYPFGLGGTGQSLHVEWDDGSSSDLPQFQLPYLRWSHVAATYDGHSLRLWLNGEKIVEKVERGRRIRSTNTPIYIGGTGRDLANPGPIHDVMIWERALSVEEIRNQMHSPAPGTGLMGWWPLDRTSGLSDRSGNGLHGELSAGAMLWSEHVPHDGPHRPDHALWVRPSGG